MSVVWALACEPNLITLHVAERVKNRTAVSAATEIDLVITGTVKAVISVLIILEVII